MNHIIAHGWLLYLLTYFGCVPGSAFGAATAGAASAAPSIGAASVAAGAASVATTSAGASSLLQAASVVNAAIAARVVIVFIYYSFCFWIHELDHSI
jgi:hypothetical protein